MRLLQTSLLLDVIQDLIQVHKSRPWTHADPNFGSNGSAATDPADEDGRIRFWREVTLSGETAPRVPGVVALEDGETVHNAFFDRNFRDEPE